MEVNEVNKPNPPIYNNRITMKDTEKPISREEWKRLLTVNESEKKAAKSRTKLLQLKQTLTAAINEIEEAVQIKYTGWMLLLKKLPSGGWECLDIVNQDNPPEAGPEWDLCLPIPDPQTIPEFSGW